MKEIITIILLCFSSVLNSSYSNVSSLNLTLEQIKDIRINLLEISINEINISNLKSKPDSLGLINYFKSTKFNYTYYTVYNMRDVWEYLELKYDIPKFISISFWIQETGWGNSGLFKNGFNLGGIKAKVGFKKYKNLMQAVNDYGRILTLPRYRKYVKEIDICNYYDYVAAYDKGGYWGSETGIPDRIYHIKKLRLDELNYSW